EQEAYDDATAVLAQQPSHEYAAALMAGILRNRGEATRAIELVDTALQTLPDSADLRVVRAQLLVDTGDKTRAEAELKRLIELRPADIEHRQRLVAFYAADGRAAEAEATLREMISQ